MFCMNCGKKIDDDSSVLSVGVMSGVLHSQMSRHRECL